MSKARPPAECAVCGATIGKSALACPECGADERTGWREQSIYDGIDLPGEKFDHEANTLGGGLPRKGKPLFWWIVAVLMLVVVVYLVLRNFFWIAP